MGFKLEDFSEAQKAQLENLSSENKRALLKIWRRQQVSDSSDVGKGASSQGKEKANKNDKRIANRKPDENTLSLSEMADMYTNI